MVVVVAAAVLDNIPVAAVDKDNEGTGMVADKEDIVATVASLTLVFRGVPEWRLVAASEARVPTAAQKQHHQQQRLADSSSHVAPRSLAPSRRYRPVSRRDLPMHQRPRLYSRVEMYPPSRRATSDGRLVFSAEVDASASL